MRRMASRSNNPNGGKQHVIQEGDAGRVGAVWHLGRSVVVVLLTIMIAACKPAALGNGAAPVVRAKVVADYPHDRDAFCQGLAIEGATVYEGTGQYDRSFLRRYDLSTGKIEVQMKLAPQYFGEGIALFGDRVYQLTWKSRVCFLYDKQTLQYQGTLRYSGEGWGLAAAADRLYLSDGTSTIRVLDPDTFRVLDRIRVRDGRRFVDKLNELEFIDGYLWANVWYEDRIARIDPQTGQVVTWIDCGHIYPAVQRPSREHVLNGIAYDSASGRVYITGKNWPRIYEVEVPPVR
ncbi:MAG: glutamine cyclotransferase [Pirellulaceae bacterium]|nr:MAG: glutamine cyclotransferase [Pirellulaceae bacterium]